MVFGKGKLDSQELYWGTLPSQHVNMIIMQLYALITDGKVDSSKYFLNDAGGKMNMPTI